MSNYWYWYWKNDYSARTWNFELSRQTMANKFLMKVLIKSMTSLNAFDIRNQGCTKTLRLCTRQSWSLSCWHCLVFDKDQMYGKSLRYSISLLTCVKGGVKVRPHLTSSLSRINCAGKAMTYLTHIWRASKFGNIRICTIWCNTPVPAKFQ